MRSQDVMRKLVVSEYVTLDGVMEDPGGAEKQNMAAGAFNIGAQRLPSKKLDELFESDALLLGKTTYEGFAKGLAFNEGRTRLRRSNEQYSKVYSAFNIKSAYMK